MEEPTTSWHITNLNQWMRRLNLRRCKARYFAFVKRNSKHEAVRVLIFHFPFAVEGSECFED